MGLFDFLRGGRDPAVAELSAALALASENVKAAVPSNGSMGYGTVIAGGGSNLGGPPKRGTKELIEAFKQNGWLRAVVGKIAWGVAEVGWRMYARTTTPAKSTRFWRAGIDRPMFDRNLSQGTRKQREKRVRSLQIDGTLREISEHPVLDLLSKPNPEMTGLAWEALLCVWLELKGEAFNVIVRRNGLPSELWPMPAHWVINTPTKGQGFFRVSVSGVNLQIAPKDMIWLRHLDPSNPYGRGTGVGESVGDELETDEYAAKFLKSWFYNGSFPGMLVAFDNGGAVANQAEMKRAEEKFIRDHMGPNNAHKVHFAAGKMNAQRLDSTFREQQIVELRKAERNFIRETWGVPPECFGIVENSNRATIGAAFYLLAQGVICPRKEFLRAELQQRLVPEFDDRAVLEYESPVPEDEEFALKAIQVSSDCFLKNEIRGVAGFEPLPELEGQFASHASGAKPGAVPGEDKKPEPEEQDDEEDEDEEKPSKV